MLTKTRISQVCFSAEMSLLSPSIVGCASLNLSFFPQGLTFGVFAQALPLHDLRDFVFFRAGDEAPSPDSSLPKRNLTIDDLCELTQQ